MPSSTPPSAGAYVAPGDILNTGIDALRQALMPRAAELPSGTTLELDFRATRMIDSVGLNLLVGVIKTVRQRNGAVRIHISNANLARILTFTQLDRHAEIIRH